MPITYTIANDRNDDGDYTDLSEAIQAEQLAICRLFLETGSKCHFLSGR